tara:strand:+ start:906 stop:1553 length:648 start_codon:yes stop_codon:yes gene_type:complete
MVSRSLVLMFFLFSGCQMSQKIQDVNLHPVGKAMEIFETAVGKATDNTLGAALDAMSGSNGDDISDAKLCLFATTKSSRGVSAPERSWSSDGSRFSQVKQRGLSCGVGQPEFFHSNSMYGDRRKLKLAYLSDKVLCKVIAKYENGKITAVPTHLEEAQKRGLPCTVSAKDTKDEGSNKLATASVVLPKPKPQTPVPKMKPTNKSWISKVRSHVYK